MEGATSSRLAAMTDRQPSGLYHYTSTGPRDRGRLELCPDTGGSWAATWTSESPGEGSTRTGWGLSLDDDRYVFGRSASNFAGVVFYEAVNGLLRATWTQTNVQGKVGNGTATRIEGEPGEGFDGAWTIVYNDPTTGDSYPAMRLDIVGEGVTRNLTWTALDPNGQPTGAPVYHGVGFIVDGQLAVGWGETGDVIETVVYGLRARTQSLLGPIASTATSELGVEDAARVVPTSS